MSYQISNPFASGAWAGNNFLIRYNPYSIFNELRWAFDHLQPFPIAGILPADRELYVDPHGHAHYEPHPMTRLLEMRNMIQSNSRRINECRIFIMTLGVVEAWWDSEIGCYMNLSPSKASLDKYPSRFFLHVLSYEDITNVLASIYNLFERYGHPDFRILITTSPVPLHATARGMDIFSANTYSKSALRTASEWFATTFDRVDYFPSYESCVLSRPERVWQPDLRHVQWSAVAFNITRMVQAYIDSNFQVKL